MTETVVGGKDALGIRKVYEDLIRNQSINTIFRPFHEKYGELYTIGSIVELRIIERPGSDFAGIEPVYNPDRFLVQIVGLSKLRIYDLEVEDFLGSSPDVRSVNELIYHLGMIYNKSAGDYDFSAHVVKINFEYIVTTHKKPGV